MSTTSLFGAESSAVLSPCGQYRYTLSRTWDEERPNVLFVMLNPSTADAAKDDPTIRRCIGFAKAWGCGGITVVNLFAYRTPSPKALKATMKVERYRTVGPENDDYIREEIRLYNRRADNHLIVAWGRDGNDPLLKWRRDEVLRMLPMADVECLDITSAGEPRHPLYCRADLTPNLYEDWKLSA